MELEREMRIGPSYNMTRLTVVTDIQLFSSISTPQTAASL